MIAALLLAGALVSSTSAKAAPSASADPDTLEIGGGTIEITFDGDDADAGVSSDEIRRYVRRAAEAVTGYLGRFPVKHVYVDITKVGGPMHFGHGVTYMGHRIKMDVGGGTTKEDVESDWRMTHEMFHLAFPDLDDEYLWMEEGLSTYLEPIARARAGQVSAESMWADMVDGLPQGEPAKGDKGMDRTHTWGRTYWGGCLFWLVADVDIREKTKDRKGLGDAIRAILDAGGDGSQHAGIRKAITAGPGDPGAADPAKRKE